MPSIAPDQAKLSNVRVDCHTVMTIADRPESSRAARSMACLASSDPS
jgi:hypothetical protein